MEFGHIVPAVEGEQRRRLYEPRPRVKEWGWGSSEGRKRHLKNIKTGDPGTQPIFQWLFQGGARGMSRGGGRERGLI